MKNSYYKIAMYERIARDGGDGGSGAGGGDGGGAGGGAGGASGAGAGGGGAGAGDTGKKFTQEDVNRFLAEDRRKHNQRMTELATELQKLKDSSLSAEERTELENRIEALRQEHMTAEQKSKEALDKASNTHKRESEKMQKERDAWKQLFTQEKIRTTIINAATAKDIDAMSASQMVDLLEHKVRLVEGLDASGKPNGEYTPKMSWEVTVDGGTTTLELTVPEVMKRMKEMPDVYGNLFKSAAVPGLGSFSAGGGKSGNGDLKDTATYMAERKKQKGPPKIGG